MHPLDPYTYILVDRKPVQHANDAAWWMWFQNIDNRRVALTEIGNKSVSTVFVGIDSNYGMGGPKPLLFETAFTDSYGIKQEWNTATWEDAKRCHAEAVNMLTDTKDRIV